MFLDSRREYKRFWGDFNHTGFTRWTALTDAVFSFTGRVHSSRAI
jgi:hypothetical protein